MQKKIGGFTLLKLIAAFQVLLGHMVTHFGLRPLESGPDVLRLLSPFEGVPVFFALSGYFIWKSLSHRSGTLRDYARRRVTRIFPELWLVVAFTALTVLVFCFQELSPVPFLGWIAAQATFLQFWTPDCLRQFGVGCPNGSLWTITIFLQFYIAVYFLHNLLHGKKPGVWCLTLLICALLNVIPLYVFSSLPEILLKLYQQTLLPYLSVFLFAGFLAEFESRWEPMAKNKAVPLLLYFLLLLGLPFDFSGAGYPLFRSMLIALFAVCFGNSFSCGFLKEDISYEIYLVHMPVLNVFLECTKAQNWGTFFIAAVLILACAYGLFRMNRWIVRRLDSHPIQG